MDALPPSIVQLIAVYRTAMFQKYAGLFITSVLGDLSVLAFLALAAIVDINVFRPTHIKLFAVLITSNVLAMFGEIGLWTSDPKSGVCNFTGFLTITGFSGDFCSSVFIVISLFWSIVLKKPKLQGIQEAMLVSVPIVYAVGWGVATIPFMGFGLDTVMCYFLDWHAPIAIVANICTVVLTALNFVLVLLMLLSLRKDSKASEILTTAPGLKTKPNQNKVKSAVDKVSTRMILYPIIMLIMGACGMIPMYFFEGNQTVGEIGEYVVSLIGIVNCLVFFFVEPTMATISRKLAASLGERRKTNDSPIFRMMESMYLFLSRTKVTKSTQSSSAASKSVTNLGTSSVAGRNFGASRTTTDGQGSTYLATA